MAKSFTASVDSFVSKTKERMEAVFKETTQQTIEIMQTPRSKGGRMRVDTGFLRASLVTTLNQPATTVTFNPEKVSVSTNSSSVSLAIADASIGDSIYAMYSANYAQAREYKDGFRDDAVGQWQNTVNQAVRRLRRL